MTLELLESTEMTILTFGVFTWGGGDSGFLEMGFICIKVLGSLF